MDNRKVLLVITTFLMISISANTLLSQNFEEVKKLVSEDGNNLLGFNLDISGDIAVVGAPLDNENGSNSGSAYIYSRNHSGVNTWSFVKKLLPSDGSTGDQFGVSVSIDGPYIAVSATFNDDNGSNSGSTYIFLKDHGGSDNWGEVKKITASDAATGDQFGVSIQIDKYYMVVGAAHNDDNGSSSGSAYIFSKDHGGSDNWGEVKKITASDASSSDWFGWSISIDNNTLAVGGVLNDDNGSNSGSAYIFLKDQGGFDNWGEVKKIVGSDASSSDRFGWSLDVSQSAVAVGTSLSETVYVFSKDQGGSNNWGEIKKLIASDASSSDRFGQTVSMENELILVGSSGNDDDGFDSGSAYIFSKDHGGLDNWGELNKIVASDASSISNFSSSVSIDGNSAIIGTLSNAAYIYEMNIPCTIPNKTIYFDNGGPIVLDTSHLDLSGIDNYDSVYLSTTSFSCNDIEHSPILDSLIGITGSDTSFCTFEITVLDTILPNAICKNTSIYLDENGEWKDKDPFLNNSLIIDESEYSKIENWLSYPASGQLVYRKTEDGSTSTDWHNNVNPHDTTLTILKLDNGIIIGGYSETSWGVNGYTGTSENFLFSLTNNYKHSHYRYGTYQFNHPNYGPTFGGGHDLKVDANMTTGYANLGYAYGCRVGSYGLSTCRNDFSGSYISWNIVELETYAIHLSSSFSQTLTSLIDNNSTDNCGIDSMYVSKSEFSCSELGLNYVDLIVKDKYNNYDTCTAEVLVIDTIAPNAICNNITVQLNSIGEYTLSVSEVDNTSDDNCSVDSTALNLLQLTCSDVGQVDVVLYVLDESVNIDSCTSTITVQPNSGGEICGDGIDNDCDGMTDEDCGNTCPDLVIDTLIIDTLYHTNTSTIVNYNASLINKGDRDVELEKYTLQHYYKDEADLSSSGSPISGYVADYIIGQDSLLVGDTLEYAFSVNSPLFVQDTTPYLALTLLPTSQAPDECSETDNVFYALAVCHQCDPCGYGYEMLSMDLTPGMTDTIRANQWLQFNGNVMPSMTTGDQLIITAGKYLEFLSGYEAKLGAEVQYDIKPCNSAALEE